jgi:hypothetical protein
MPRRPFRPSSFSPRLVILLTSVGPALLLMGIGLADSNPDAWIPMVVGGVLTVAGIAYIWLTRPHSWSRWLAAWNAGKFGAGPVRPARTPKVRPERKSGPKPQRRRPLDRRRH